MFGGWPRKQVNIFELGCSGDHRLNPLAAYEEKPLIKYRNFAFDTGSLTKVAGTAILVNVVCLGLWLSRNVSAAPVFQDEDIYVSSFNNVLKINSAFVRCTFQLSGSLEGVISEFRIVTQRS